MTISTHTAEPRRRRAPPIPPRLLRVSDAAAYCGVAVKDFLAELPPNPIKIGRQRRWDVRALDAWIDTLSGAVYNTEEKPSKSGIDRIRSAKTAKQKPGGRTQ